MIPLVDLHCHLHAGLDDGPRTDEDAMAMCQIAYEEGTRSIAATAHQNESWPDVTPDVIRASTQSLAQRLRDMNVPLSVVPCGEVMVHPDMQTFLENGELLTMADRGQYMLIELPHGLYVDLHHIIEFLTAAGIRPILAHPERCPELLHDAGTVSELIRVGCLMQVNTHSITQPQNRLDERALKTWFQRDMVHVLGSDGHSPRRRPPRMAEAYHKIVSWAGPAVANRVASTNGLAILQNLRLRVPPPRRKQTSWFSSLWS